jgi:subtilisin family serine protease
VPNARPRREVVERARLPHPGAMTAETPNAPAAGDPLANLQWDMKMIHATTSGSYAVERGDKRVLVGVMDTGIDASHPDLNANVDVALSRNFTHDIPSIDGPCSQEPDHSCDDPPTVDENGHGTHVAGIIAAALNGLGTAGVAPNVTLVNIRAGQDSGYFFIKPFVDALTYAADVGIDVVNMSFYIDPWLYNCPDNPADSAAGRAEQRTIEAATQRALRYATLHEVTLISALGNDNTNLDHPTVDDTSPDYPLGTEHHRDVTNRCVDLPAEGNNVISVSALGSTGRKAYYSNWGVEQTDLSAPGGDVREFYGTPRYGAPDLAVLSAYPKSLAVANGELNPDGTPNTPYVVRSCKGTVCAYYQYLQGTSMAAPHAVGVAALIISRFGHVDHVHPGQLAADPHLVDELLESTAADHPCPTPATLHYPDPDLGPEYDATCDGTTKYNGFYGAGIVDALAAVRG